MEVTIRSFRAIDDLEACRKYAAAHMDILKIFGITKITTANDSWMYNPNVYVIYAESPDGSRPLGGARIHLYDKDYPLPFVRAVEELAPTVYEFVEKHVEGGTGEICGLWNAREVAGMGIGTLFLARAGVALASQLPLHSLFVLCGEHTIGITLEKGFTVETQLGNNGTFYYPKEDLVATLAVINDINDLSAAKPLDRDVILSLRENNEQTRVEMGPMGPLIINYRLKLNSLKSIVD